MANPKNERYKKNRHRDWLYKCKTGHQRGECLVSGVRIHKSQVVSNEVAAYISQFTFRLYPKKVKDLQEPRRRRQHAKR